MLHRQGCGLNVSSPGTYVEILTPKIMKLGGGAFGGRLDHEGGSLTGGISDFIKEAQVKFLLFYYMKTQQEGDSCDPGRGSSPERKHTGTLCPDLRTVQLGA